MDAEKEEQKPPTIGVTIEDSDIFETDDLPEDDQQLHKDLCNEVQEVEGIDQGKLDVREAFKAFAHKRIDALQTDFSDSIAVNKAGYLTSQEEETETWMQKKARLSKQLLQLKQEMALLEGKEEENVSDLMSKVEHLGRKLKICGCGVGGGVGVGGGGGVGEAVKLENDETNADGRKLMNELNAFLSTPPTTLKAPTTPTNATQYDIIITHKHSLDSLLLKGLEQRVARCETVVGKLNSISLSSPENTGKSILGALSLVVARFSLLDLSQLAHFESTLLAIHQKTLQASAKSDASEIADKVDKLSRTYEVVKKVDGVLDRVMSACQQIKSSAEEHQSAAQFCRALKEIGGDQEEMSVRLQCQSDCLKQIQAFLAPQMQLFEDNCQHIEALVN